MTHVLLLKGENISGRLRVSGRTFFQLHLAVLGAVLTIAVLSDAANGTLLIAVKYSLHKKTPK